MFTQKYAVGTSDLNKRDVYSLLGFEYLRDSGDLLLSEFMQSHEL
jgi:hypothetical protein